MINMLGYEQRDIYLSRTIIARKVVRIQLPFHPTIELRDVGEESFSLILWPETRLTSDGREPSARFPREHKDPALAPVHCSLNHLTSDVSLFLLNVWIFVSQQFRELSVHPSAEHEE